MDSTPNDLNLQCLCASLDREKLFGALKAETGADLLTKYFSGTHAATISDVPMFVDHRHMEKMQDIIAAVEAVAKTDQFYEAVMAGAPAIAKHRPGAVGVLMGYDFHLSPDGPKLIEINTNAGGALINAYLSQAQALCCTTVRDEEEDERRTANPAAAIMQSFLQDWRRQRKSDAPETIVIVDEDPEHQYFFPELLLFKNLFGRNGVRATIASPEELTHHDGALWRGEKIVDLVYNRLTDFYFEDEQSSALKSAYLANEVVVTPNPHAHALLANKRNLSFLCDDALLHEWNIDEPHIRSLVEGVPKTIPLDATRQEEFWSARKKLFFKPAAGFGSKAAYRGDKITRRVWSEILENDYVAQDIVKPSVRNVIVDSKVETMKVDIRNYTYDGSILLTAARLYQGQTTNMRTPGGGFSPAFAVNLAKASVCSCA